MDRLLQKENPGNLIALYMFLSYSARWQQTHQPKCTVSYIAKGLKWSERSVQREKAVLREMGLIEDVPRKDKDGKIEGWYVRVNYFVKVHGDTDGGVDHGAKNAGGGILAPKCCITDNVNTKELVDTRESKSSTGGEKKKPTEPSMPDCLKTPEFEKVWKEFQTHRRQKGSKLTPIATERLFAVLAKRPDQAAAGLNEAIDRNWSGFKWDWYDNCVGSKQTPPKCIYEIEQPIEPRPYTGFL